MKKTLLILGIVCSYNFGWSQCETNVSATDTTLCPGDSVQLFASGPASPLTTTFAAGNNHRGNMFDIVATNTVTIESFDAHPMGNTDFEIYYKVGSYTGSETNSGAWTLLGSATGVVAMGAGIPTPIPISVNITIPAGQTYAFYVTSTNLGVSLNYTNGSTEGAVFASDANITFLEGIGMEYPFAAGGSWFTPRIWNGVIHYSTGTTTYLWSTGGTAATETVAPTVQTTYYVDITPSGCPTVTDSVTIYMNPVPSVDLGADTTVCPGTQVTLDAGPGLSYNWNNGFSTNQTISVLPGTNYMVQVTNAEGCSDYDTIAVIADTPPSVNLGADFGLCPGETTTLDAGNSGSTYVWGSGETTQTINAGPGSYSVTVTNASGCTGSDNITVTELTPPTVDAGADVTICVNESTVLDAGAGYAAYLWSTSASTQTITVDGGTVGAGTHDYTVQVTDNNGCTNMDTVSVIVDECLGIEELTSGLVKAYPNPTSGNFIVETLGASSDLTFKLYSAHGILILEESVGQKYLIDMSSLAIGTYFVKIYAADKFEVLRVIKQ